ncbi:hypothetical protein COCC4DRAFT_155506 [Bipolaris maydis ATCC 48331]|uniref:Uncharacterized protein n=2 Tax=Cochliobolus heterostrophus TaxID=5016 RepID=M2TYM5_COCH5|nr:uncharacterized protein COCC4DRAFT_155506 [Bipolaris maydis ATCC 48331]EMD86931.1 hypothetical protein COCHEDRAFT_1160058 [Bipolaris maydis C5]KAJ5021720.1 hypothetical protein J3E73DRAFT_199011 [Bipolaris maydis]ENH98540.1 hypothetical protein COCC4DRAFT_155506 [Bipolaris maydis ATCC 48331]KAJ6204258.1 hypothetical protein PSV09DRAFT_1160058 [Bipolaris maydis]KAJ6276807.1 hypothetical protein J3E71DRAFT_186879 [Bipolaris maydis]
MSQSIVSQFGAPKKARLKGAAEYLKYKKIPFYHNDLFRYFGVSKRHLDRCDRFLQELGWSVRVLTWSQLSEELDLGVTGRTLREYMGSMDYHKCIACLKGWTRKNWVEVMLQRYLKPEDWRRVRFSDEVYWSLGAEEKIQIIRKLGERYCADCIYYTLDRHTEKAHQRQHSWVAIGYNFKLDLYFYNTKSSSGKMSYLRGDDFVLEEDNDSGHGGGHSKGGNIVKSWKQHNGLESYFNCPSSLDLALIENCWRPPKQFMLRYPDWDEFETRELAIEGWQKVS